jgi:uncharacterized phage protein (predicted DNA packaging)
MDASALINALKLHARIDGSAENAGLSLMLATAAADVAHAASYTLPDDVLDLPADIQFAIIDQAAKTYDQRGADEGKVGLSLAASRIVSRYRGVSLGMADTEAEA